MGSLLWSLASFLVALGVLITVHEWGHFWVARRCGVKVERFSIGFGKTLLRRCDKQGTEYVLALIPLGGYVKMLDERVEQVPEQMRHQAFNNKTLGQRAAIISAGPIANFLFAVLAYWLVFMLGVPSIKPVVGDVQSGSIAANAQIISGMELKSVNGVKVTDWDSVRLALFALIGEKRAQVGVSVANSDAVVLTQLDLEHWQFSPDKEDPVASLGIKPKGPEIEPVLAEVRKDSAAQRAGLQPGDRIVKIEGVALEDWAQFVQEVKNSPEKPLRVSIEREGFPLSLTLIPDKKQVAKDVTEGFVGVVPKVIPLPDEYRILRQYGPFTALQEAVEKTWQLMTLTVDMMGKLVTGDIKLNVLSGPVSIAQGAGISAAYGFVSFLLFLALISVNLGIINLVPLPVLDGGHLLFLLIEKIKGAPVSEQVQEYSYRIGAAMLVLLMGLALFNDFSRL